MKSFYNSRYNFLLEELSEEEKIVLLPSTFDPPHKGYYNFINYYSKLAGNNGKVLALLTPSRDSDEVIEVTNSHKLSTKVIKAVLDIYVKDMNNVKVLICPKNPIEACKNIWKDMHSGILILGGSKNDISKLTSVKEYIESKNQDIIIIDPSTTACDAVVATGSTINPESFYQALNDSKQLLGFLPDRLSDDDKLKIIKLLKK